MSRKLFKSVERYGRLALRIIMQAEALGRGFSSAFMPQVGKAVA